MIVQSSGSERTTAAAVNISAIFFPYLGPVIGAVLARNSKFVRFHAYRCLIEQIVSTLIIGTLAITSLAFTIYSLSKTMEGGFDWHKIDWQTIVIKSVITYLLLALWGVINTILSIRDAVEALRGQLPAKPKWTERKAMKLAKIGNN